MTARHQGLGGAPLGSDSPLFGGREADPEATRDATDKGEVGPIPPWDPRADDYASPPDEYRIETPEEAEAALAELRSLLAGR